MKRTATQTAAKACKKAKQEQDPVEAGLAAVSAALGQAEGLTAGAAEMLTKALPSCLGVPQDARHKYQQGLTDLVREELSNIESNMQRLIAEAQELARETEASKTSSGEAASEAKARVQAQENVLQQSKVQLADIAVAFRAARQALQDAEFEQTAQSKEINRAAATKGSLENLLQALETVHERPEEVDASVEGVMRHLKVDDSMKTAMPSALTKAPDARGAFDVMVFDQLRALGATKLQSLEALLQASEPLKASLAQTVQAASSALEAAKERQVASADSFLQEQARLKALQEGLAGAQATLRDAAKSSRQAASDSGSAEAELDLFRQEALSAFTFLCERTTPAPEPEALPEALPEAPEEAAAPEGAPAPDPSDKIQGAAQAMELGPQELGCAGA